MAEEKIENVSFKVSLLENEKSLEKIEVRRFVVPQDCSTSLVYLKEKIRTIFNLGRSDCKIFWIDEDNDNVAILSDDELVIALQELNGPVYKLQVVKKDLIEFKSTDDNDSAKVNEGEVHPGVVCDSCDGPVKGFRYKCMTCPDYDLCGTCEAKNLHPGHNMIRIATPETIWPRHFMNRLHRMSARASRKGLWTGNCEDFDKPWRCSSEKPNRWGAGKPMRSNSEKPKSENMDNTPLDENKKKDKKEEKGCQFPLPGLMGLPGFPPTEKPKSENMNNTSQDENKKKDKKEETIPGWLPGPGMGYPMPMGFPPGLGLLGQPPPPRPTMNPFTPMSFELQDGSGNVLETGNLDNSAQLQHLVGLANHFNKHFGEHFGTPMTPHEPSKENDSKKSEEQEPPKEDSKKEDLDDFVELTKDAKAKTSKANSPGEVLKELDEEIQGEISKNKEETPKKDEDWTILDKATTPEKEPEPSAPSVEQVEPSVQGAGALYPSLEETETKKKDEVREIKIDTSNYKPKVKVAIQAMENMGFSNEDGWLSNLLEKYDGDIGKVLDLLQPVKPVRN